MSGSRGKANPDANTRRMLFAHSGGFCQNPECNANLFHEIGDSSFHIAEMAHVFSAEDGGPRAKEGLSEEDRGKYENLIILCPTCHTKVDKAEEDYPDSTLKKWKNDHTARINAVFGILSYSTRKQARQAIEAILDENLTIFNAYGPETDEKLNPESEMPALWLRKIREKIIPNNRIILRTLTLNRKLLTPEELRTLELPRNGGQVWLLNTSSTRTPKG